MAVAMQSGQRRPGYSRQRFGLLGLRWQCTLAQSINPLLCTEEQAAANSAFLASLIIHRSQAQVTAVMDALDHLAASRARRSDLSFGACCHRHVYPLGDLAST